MKTEVKKIDNTKREIAVSAEGEIVKNKFEDIFKKVSVNAKVKGFRPGHVPREILEKEFSSLVHEQVLRELIPELYDQAIEKESIHALDMPTITEVKLDRSSISFKAQVEITPDIGVKNYKGIKIEYKMTAVGADEIKRNLDSLKESRKVESIDEKCAKSWGYPSVSELEKAVERQIAVQKDNAQRQEIEHLVIEHLTKNLEVKLPQSLVNKQLEDLLRNAKVELAMRGIPKEKLIEQEEDLRKNLRPQAENQVKVYLVLADIARRENIAVNENMPRAVMEFLFSQADWAIKES